jgi:methionyl-tRNA formyltransferase
MNTLNKNKISTIFMGTPDFAVPILESVLKIDYIDLTKIITQPDKKVGRKKILTPPPVKIYSQKMGLEILQPEKIKDKNFIKKLKNLKPDLIIVVAYGQILPNEIIEIPKYGCINVHASLLPKHRGASPIQTAILNGDKETGITIMKIDGGLDSGDIISQEKIEIKKDDTSKTLRDKLSALGAKLLVKTLPDYLTENIKPAPQDDSKATETKILNRKDGEIDFENKTAGEIERKLRAFTPWPGIYTFFNGAVPQRRGGETATGRKLKILELKIEDKINPLIPIGKLYEYKNNLIINCKDGSLILDTVQLEGKKEISGQEFINGYLK